MDTQAHVVVIGGGITGCSIAYHLTEQGYGDLLIACYPTLRKYFADFIQLPFAAGSGSEPLMQAIELGECWRSSTFIGLRNRSLRRHAWSNPFWFSA